MPVFIVVAAPFLFASADVRLPDNFPFARWMGNQDAILKALRLLSLMLVIFLLSVFVLSLGYRFQMHHYFRGVTHQLLHAEGGHPSFLLGIRLGGNVEVLPLVTEFLDGNEKVAPGETGEVVCTGLTNYAMPLIRYRLHDVVVPSDEECPCGVRLPLLKSVEGRLNDFLIASE